MKVCESPGHQDVSNPKIEEDFPLTCRFWIIWVFIYCLWKTDFQWQNQHL